MRLDLIPESENVEDRRQSRDWHEGDMVDDAANEAAARIARAVRRLRVHNDPYPPMATTVSPIPQLPSIPVQFSPPTPRSRPAEAPLPPGMVYPSGPFTPQGTTGGGVNIPGRLASGAPARMRSEALDYEIARRELRRNPPASAVGAMINPQQASFVDAIRRRHLREQAATGYQPGDLAFGSIAPADAGQMPSPQDIKSVNDGYWGWLSGIVGKR